MLLKSVNFAAALALVVEEARLGFRSSWMRTAETPLPLRTVEMRANRIPGRIAKWPHSRS